MTPPPLLAALVPVYCVVRDRDCSYSRGVCRQDVHTGRLPAVTFRSRRASQTSSLTSPASSAYRTGGASVRTSLLEGEGWGEGLSRLSSVG